jgi:hypothetical protein
MGATVHVVAADVAEPADVTRVLDVARANGSPLRGVLHLAAVVDDQLLVGADDARVQRVLRPKVAGAVNLYRALEHESLDFIVLFSSIATVVSQPGQGAYAAANAFLDGLARYAVANGRFVRSVQWGPWADTGLVNEAGTQRSVRAYEAQGIHAMSPALGVAVLGAALSRTAPVLLAASVDWQRFGVATADQPGADEFAELVASSASSHAAAQASSSRSAASAASRESSFAELRAQLAAAVPGRARAALIEPHVREQLAAVL